MKLNLPKAIQRHRNFSVRGPLAISSMWLWISTLIIILKVDPSTLEDVIVPNMYFPLLTMLFFALLSTLWVISRSKKLSFLWSSVLIIFLVLSLYQMGHALNMLLLFGIAICAHLVIVMEQKQRV